MAKPTYSQLSARIAELQTQADVLRKAEVQGVISRIREAISVYGLTERDLFGQAGTSRRATKAKRAAAKTPKYADGTGNEWGGRGPRPAWLREALKAGKRLEDFAVGATPAAASEVLEPEAPSKRKAARGSKAARKVGKAPVKFRDGDGNSWSGRGTRPRWLAAAIAAGKKLEEFAV